MKSIFMGKSAAQWLTKNIEYFVVGISSKQFCTFRDGDFAYTLQQSSYYFSNFLFLIELKVGGFRRSVIIPEGRAKNGWRTFGFELRKMLELNQYAVGGSGLINLLLSRIGVIQRFKTRELLLKLCKAITYKLWTASIQSSCASKIRGGHN